MPETNQTSNLDSASTASAIHGEPWIENYLLGRLSPAEQEAFEEHFLDCPTCLDELETARRLQAAGRQLAVETLSAKILPFAQPRAVPSMGRGQQFWQRVAAVAAVAALALVAAGWLEIRGLQHRLVAGEQALAAALAPRADLPTLTLGLLRGEAPAALLQLTGNESQVVLLAAAPEDGAEVFRVALSRGSEKLWQSSDAVANHRGEVVITLPTELLVAGEYRLEIAGATSVTHRFLVKR